MLGRRIGLIGLVTLITIMAGLLLVGAPAAEADCGGDLSSCKSCHESDQQMPVSQVGVWHTQHAFADFCANCHAGDGAAAGKEPAHLGMRPVLDHPDKSCAACHANNYATLTAQYVTLRDEKPGEAAVLTPPPLPPPGSQNGLFAALNGAVMLGLAGLVWAVERGPLRRMALAKAPAFDQAAPRNPMARKRWSPYWAGAGLGVIATLSLWLSAQPVGASGAFLTSASALLKWVDSPLSRSVYFSQIMAPRLSWQLLLVGGMVLGALLSALWSRDFHLESVPDRWAQVFGSGRWKRWGAMFAGGLILQYGASIAGGCTSGLAIAGSLQLSGSGFLFIAGLFGSGLVTARLLYGRNA